MLNNILISSIITDSEAMLDDFVNMNSCSYVWFVHLFKREKNKTDYLGIILVCPLLIWLYSDL